MPEPEPMWEQLTVLRQPVPQWDALTTLDDDVLGMPSQAASARVCSRFAGAELQAAGGAGAPPARRPSLRSGRR